MTQTKVVNWQLKSSKRSWKDLIAPSLKTKCRLSSNSSTQIAPKPLNLKNLTPIIAKSMDYLNSLSFLLTISLKMPKRNFDMYEIGYIVLFILSAKKYGIDQTPGESCQGLNGFWIFWVWYKLFYYFSGVFLFNCVDLVSWFFLRYISSGSVWIDW